MFDTTTTKEFLVCCINLSLYVNILYLMNQANCEKIVRSSNLLFTQSSRELTNPPPEKFHI